MENRLNGKEILWFIVYSFWFEAVNIGIFNGQSSIVYCQKKVL